MKRSLFKLIVILILSCCTFNSEAQLDLGADFVSRYLWRGQILASGPAVQPSLVYQKSNFEIGFWGSYGLANGFDGTEADIYVSYQFKEVKLMITDFFFPSDAAGLDFNNYFDYGENTTSHVFEAMLIYDSDSNPFKVELAYDFYGDDPDNSIYLGLFYSLSDQTDIFLQSGNGWYTFENPGEDDAFGLVGIGITHNKEIKISDSFNLPVHASFVLNPEGEKIFLVFGFSL